MRLMNSQLSESFGAFENEGLYIILALIKEVNVKFSSKLDLILIWSIQIIVVYRSKIAKVVRLSKYLWTVSVDHSTLSQFVYWLRKCLPRMFMIMCVEVSNVFLNLLYRLKCDHIYKKRGKQGFKMLIQTQKNVCNYYLFFIMKKTWLLLSDLC